MKKDEKGALVVETITSFTLFVFFVVSILSLINFVVIQSRIQNAMAQTVQAFSMYEYCIHLTGMDADLMATADKAAKTRVEVGEFTNNIKDVLDGIEGLGNSRDISSAYSSMKGIQDSGGKAATQVKNWGETLANDPQEIISKILTWGLDEGARYAFCIGAKPVVLRYLGNGSLSGEEYLEKMGVIDFRLDPARSFLLDADGSVQLTATYEIGFSFGILPLPFDGTIKFEQTVSTKAWLGGAGKGFSG